MFKDFAFIAMSIATSEAGSIFMEPAIGQHLSG